MSTAPQAVERQGSRQERSNRAARRLRVFAVEPDAVQLTWRNLGPGPVRITGAGPDRTVRTGGGPGAVVLDHLIPECGYDIEIRLADDDELVGRLQVTTPPHPPGEELARLATVSDVHLGRETFGNFDTMRERHEPPVGFAERCAKAAVDEMAAWGATRLVGKGDLVDHASHDEWEALVDFVDHVRSAGLEFDMVPGNHEAKPYREIDRDDAMRRYGFTPTDGARLLDVPGVAALLVDTAWDDHHRGRLDHALDAVPDLVAGVPALVLQHHFTAPAPVPYFWPPGVPWSESIRFLDALDRAATTTLLAAGHSHRHRRREWGSVTVTEVGSPKDYPGTWAGYVVHEGGIRQVVRRVARPDCIEWTEYTRWAGLGVWGQWSPGRMDERCFSLAWPT